jgi:predicted anti-sigma-YlaC factor YlaD
MIRFWRDILRVLDTPCREHARMMTLELESPLSRGERVGLWLHLRICKGCRGLRAQLVRLRSVLDRAAPLNDPEVVMPEPVRRRLRERVREESPKN